MREPPNVIDVWLLGDADSYTDTVLRLLGLRPSTPYGFFMPSHQALFMNISTGGGTLVHELVHPFVGASFPAVPAWFNEGLASLYEAVREEHGQMWGLPNWRLAGLQRAIRAGKLPSFATMTADSRDHFYTSGTSYAQARYLCLYLQEKGLLHRYYDQFRAGVGGRSERIQDARSGARGAGHGRVREAVAGVGARVGCGLGLRRPEGIAAFVRREIPFGRPGRRGPGDVPVLAARGVDCGGVRAGGWGTTGGRFKEAADGKRAFESWVGDAKRDLGHHVRAAHAEHEDGVRRAGGKSGVLGGNSPIRLTALSARMGNSAHACSDWYSTIPKPLGE